MNNNIVVAQDRLDNPIVGGQNGNRFNMAHIVPTSVYGNAIRKYAIEFDPDHVRRTGVAGTTLNNRMDAQRRRALLQKVTKIVTDPQNTEQLKRLIGGRE